MTTKYTPGPWAIITDVPDSAIGYRAIVANDNGEPGETICNPSPMGAANASLIAAAPELADALAWALDQIEDDLCPDHQAALEHARAVLARAQGAGL